MINILFIILLIVMIETCCIYCLKQGKLQHSKYYTICGILGYTIVGSILYTALQHCEIGKIALIWQCIGICSGFLLGYTLYGENISSHKQIAIVLSLLAVFVISIEVNNDEKLL